MKASVEISYYPLKEEYIPVISDFLDRLKSYEELVIKVNTMSTQVFGDYFRVMEVLTKEMHTSFRQPGSVFVLKVINACLAPEVK